MKRNNIWIVTIGEPIFTEDNKLRYHRSGLLAKYISENTSNNVVWWTSTFNHFTKKHHFNTDKSVKINENLKMIAIKGKGYKKNVSVDRIVDHYQISKTFGKMISLEKLPDIIICSFPTLGLCLRSIKFGKKNKIPILIDYRDMWPEVYIKILPKILKVFGRIILNNLFKNTRYVFKNATGIIGITENFLNIGLKKAERKKTFNDAVFPLVYKESKLSEIDLDNAKSFWESKINFKNDYARICFFGAIGYQSNWNTVIEALKIINNDKTTIEFVICGSGDMLNDLKIKTRNVRGIKFPGFVNESEIQVLMNNSNMGLCAYYPSEDYMNSIPGKAVEYLYGGIPILSTLKNGILGDFIEKESIGYNYQHDSVESLISSIKMLIKNKENFYSKKNKIKKLYYQNFDSNIVFKKYNDFIEKTIVNFKIN